VVVFGRRTILRLLWKPSSEVADLAPGDVHVWAACLDDLSEDALGVPLSADERDRGGRFHFKRDRRRFVTARGLLRVLLGRYLDVDPAGLLFGYGPRGKPCLAERDEPRFNLSHSGGLALLVFARGCELGVDIEQERPLPESADIARHYFSAREGAGLLSLREDERDAAFFRCWTRKEAFVKATGDGLSRPLDAFDVTLAPGEPARLLRVDGEPEAVRRFRLEDLRPAPGFAGALAIDGETKRVVRRAWDQSREVRHGSGRAGRQDGLQGRLEPRGAVLHLAGGPREPARLA
jgi:4'-phosphopantetheinyl transferase